MAGLIPLFATAALVLAIMAFISTKGMLTHMREVDDRVDAARRDAAAAAQRAETAQAEVAAEVERGVEQVRKELTVKLEELRTSLTSSVREAQQRLGEFASERSADQAQIAERFDAIQKNIARAQDSLSERIQSVEDGAHRALAAAEKRAAEQAQDMQSRLASMEQRVAAALGQFEGIDAAVRQAAADVRALQNNLNHISDRMDALEDYVKATFEAKLDAAFKALDGTVAGVLGEMKGELLRGVQRIEEIESLVETRQKAEQRLLGAQTDAPGLEEPNAREEDEAAAEAEEVPRDDDAETV